MAEEWKCGDCKNVNLFDEETPCNSCKGNSNFEPNVAEQLLAALIFGGES